MVSKTWETVCYYCQKRGIKRPSCGRPTSPPTLMNGRCDCSPNGKHKPQWRVAE